MASLEIPVFTYGTYTSMGGEDVTFTDQLMRDLVKNTRFAIQTKALTPPLGYDEIDSAGNYKHRGTEAHGNIVDAKLSNGVVSVVVDSPSEKFRADVKAKRRLRVSGEFNPKFEYTDTTGRKVAVGPTIVGLAALGAYRPALKNPAIVPLADLNFGESVSAADAWATREELRARGFVAQTLEEGKYAFSEVEVDSTALETKEDEEQLMPMTEAEKAEMQSMIKSAVTAQTSSLETKVAALETENATLKGQVKSFSESSKREGDTAAFSEKLVSDRKAQGAALPALFLDEGRKILNDASFSEDQREKVKKLMTLAPAALTGRSGTQKEGAASGGGNDETDNDEPKALADLKPRHFSDVAANEEKIAAGLVAFSEFKVDAFKGIEKNQDAQIEKLATYVRRRDIGDVQ